MVSVARTARAVVFKGHGAPESVLEVKRIPLPTWTSKSVQIKFMASPVNPADVNQIQGLELWWFWDTDPKFEEYGAVGGNEGIARLVDVGIDVKGVVPKTSGFGVFLLDSGFYLPYNSMYYLPSPSEPSSPESMDSTPLSDNSTIASVEMIAEKSPPPLFQMTTELHSHHQIPFLTDITAAAAEHFTPGSMLSFNLLSPENFKRMASYTLHERPMLTTVSNLHDILSAFPLPSLLVAAVIKQYKLVESMDRMVIRCTQKFGLACNSSDVITRQCRRHDEWLKETFKIVHGNGGLQHVITAGREEDAISILSTLDLLEFIPEVVENVFPRLQLKDLKRYSHNLTYWDRWIRSLVKNDNHRSLQVVLDLMMKKSEISTRNLLSEYLYEFISNIALPCGSLNSSRLLLEFQEKISKASNNRLKTFNIFHAPSVAFLDFASTHPRVQVIAAHVMEEALSQMNISVVVSLYEQWPIEVDIMAEVIIDKSFCGVLFDHAFPCLWRHVVFQFLQSRLRKTTSGAERKSYSVILAELVGTGLIKPTMLDQDILFWQVAESADFGISILKNPDTLSIPGITDKLLVSMNNAITCEVLKDPRTNPKLLADHQKLRRLANEYPQALVFVAWHPLLRDGVAFLDFASRAGIRSISLQMSLFDRFQALFNALLEDLSVTQFGEFLNFIISDKQPFGISECPTLAKWCYNCCNETVLLDYRIVTSPSVFSTNMWVLLSRVSATAQKDLVNYIIKDSGFDKSAWTRVLSRVVTKIDPSVFRRVMSNIPPLTQRQKVELDDETEYAFVAVFLRGDPEIFETLLSLPVWGAKGKRGRIACNITLEVFRQLDLVNPTFAKELRYHPDFCHLEPFHVECLFNVRPALLA
ncbi:hypothetical protein BC829DRAFT_414303 [Chytridium lagenaria]|nr:hypothetical protein BC829DRAFT_414303 [Chytridium lagenaria]